MSGTKLILASKSVARRTVLENAGVFFEWRDAGVDEEIIKTQAVRSAMPPEDLARALAEAKAAAIAEQEDPDALVIGCDQVLALDGYLFDKPATRDDARVHLRAFSGRVHRLISAICLARSNGVVWSHVAVAEMHVRDLSDDFIDGYLADEGEQILTSVGAYLLERRGVQLFEKIDGDYFTILGLPLLPLLEELRKRGILPA
ncbi:MAG: Maf family nucleotide pyrophosphatase [Rhodospirillales bacterium]